MSAASSNVRSRCEGAGATCRRSLVLLNHAVLPIATSLSHFATLGAACYTVTNARSNAHGNRAAGAGWRRVPERAVGAGSGDPARPGEMTERSRVGPCVHRNAHFRAWHTVDCQPAGPVQGNCQQKAKGGMRMSRIRTNRYSGGSGLPVYGLISDPTAPQVPLPKLRAKITKSLNPTSPSLSRSKRASNPASSRL